MFALLHVSWPRIQCGDHATAAAEAAELTALAEQKGTLFWKALGIAMQGCLAALTGEPAEAVDMIGSGMSALRSTGATLWAPLHLSYLTLAHAQRGEFDDARRCIAEAMRTIETTKERWCEAEVHRLAGEIALTAQPQPSDTSQAQSHFANALAVARGQQAKSWELRAAMSLARLYRNQGRPDAARDLLAPIYGWFTEGFDTSDLQQAKVLLDALPR